MRNACRVDVHQMPEDGAVRRKIGCVLQDVLEGHLVVEFEFDPSAQMRGFPLQLAEPEIFIG
jgi:hypothetical protein